MKPLRFLLRTRGEIQVIFNRMEGYNENGSGLVILLIKKLEVNIYKFKKEFVLKGGRGKANLNK